MSSHHKRLVALGFIGVAFAASLAVTYPSLPARVASHFNAAGVPDGWMSRSAFVSVMAATAGGISAGSLALFYGLRFFPVSAINLPRRDYWLAPERRAATFDYLWGRGVVLVCMEMLFLLGAYLLAVAANTTHPPRLPAGIWLLTALFAAACAVWTGALVRRFTRAS